METTVKERQAGPVTVLELSGRITVTGGSQLLDDKIQSLITGGQRALLLDFSQVTALDSQGIRTLVRGVTSIANRGGELKLLKLSRPVRVALDITRLLTIIEAFDDEEAAKKSFTT